MDDPAIGALLGRPAPKQARARLRVQQILDGAVQVLTRHPPSQLSATLIAAQADVPVSSIYRYFPTLDDLVDELYLRAAADLRDGLERAVDGPGGWRDRLAAVVELLIGFLRDHPFYRPLLTLIAARRGPQGLDDDYNSDILAFLAARWQAGQDGFHGADAGVVAATTVQIALSLEELVLRAPSPEAEQAHLAELHAVLDRYLSAYLTDDPTLGDA
ncbi:TetR/AcrR family transcriptional regulator [Paracoccus sp. p4-l81]|uniref:TetR/AcrR family transcriptional regulator n=1 Tax=unclassified Paracoccus (in: a-proteobacteria) TaxID=2688777 RepID=UPI0035B84136